MGNKEKKSKEKVRYPLAPLLLFIYLSMVIYVTFFAWNYGASLGEMGPGGRNYNLDPLLSIRTIHQYGSPQMIFTIIYGNIIMFIPFGILLPLTVEYFKKSNKAVRIMPVVFLGMVFSFMIEVNQFVFTNRVANIDDIILNTTGALLGVLFYRFVRAVTK
ncbi:MULTISPECIES: VanZ family protein [Bacillaceae]|nr:MULTISPECIES: VanZ family protein [Bacillaceae]